MIFYCNENNIGIFIIHNIYINVNSVKHLFPIFNIILPTFVP